MVRLLGLARPGRYGSLAPNPNARSGSHCLSTRSQKCIEGIVFDGAEGPEHVMLDEVVWFVTRRSCTSHLRTRNWLMAPDPSLPRRLLAPRRPSLHGCIRCSAADECFGSANCLAERGGIAESARADNQCLLHCALLFFFLYKCVHSFGYYYALSILFL